MNLGAVARAGGAKVLRFDGIDEESIHHDHTPARARCEASTHVSYFEASGHLVMMPSQDGCALPRRLSPQAELFGRPAGDGAALTPDAVGVHSVLSSRNNLTTNQSNLRLRTPN